MIVYILFIAHFLADFTFQSAKMAQKKLNNFIHLIYHAIIYTVIFSFAIFPFVNFETAVFPYIIIISSHFLIDWIRKLVYKKSSGKTLIFTAFIADQILHILILFFIYYAFDLGAQTTSLYSHIKQWPYYNSSVIYCFMFVVLWDPASVFIKKLFTYIMDGNSCEQEENDPPAGRIIGKLERIIVAVLILCNQFGAIGFVLTAKSIARYKQLEDKNFAEKYLVGTLTSVAIAFVVTVILKQFL